MNVIIGVFSVFFIHLSEGGDFIKNKYVWVVMVKYDDLNSYLKLDIEAGYIKAIFETEKEAYEYSTRVADNCLVEGQVVSCVRHRVGIN